MPSFRRGRGVGAGLGSLDRSLCVGTWASVAHTAKRKRSSGAEGQERGLEGILISVLWGSGCQGLRCQPGKLENILMVFCRLLPLC